jgi:chemotaxis response regulator CheB
MGIVSDSAAYAEQLRRVVSGMPGDRVAWTAHDEESAAARTRDDPADVALLDISGELDGAAVTRGMLGAHPCPILLLAASVDARPGPIFAALGAGASDVVGITVSAAGERSVDAAALAAKIGALRSLHSPRGSAAARVPAERRRAGRRLVALGASAGGPGALAVVLAELPRDVPAPLVIVQHIDERFAPSMAAWLATRCALPVRTAAAGDVLLPGTVYLAGRNDHLVLRDRDTLDYTRKPADVPYRPSIDVFFRSVARYWKGEAVGVLLTGMGRDGAAGLRALRDAGAFTIAQDRDSSAVYGIPKAAAEMQAAVEILPLDRIAGQIRQALLPDSPQ